MFVRKLVNTTSLNFVEIFPGFAPSLPNRSYATDSKHLFQFETLKTLYMSIIEPNLRYCCSVWECCGTTEIDRLQKLQNRAARIVTNSSYDAPSMPLIRSLGWETIDDLTNQAFKSVNNLAPQYLIDLFTRNSHSSSYNLRNTDSDIQIPKKETSNGQKCFLYRGAKVWNRLQLHAKQTSPISRFKFYTTFN